MIYTMTSLLALCVLGALALFTIPVVIPNPSPRAERRFTIFAVFVFIFWFCTVLFGAAYAATPPRSALPYRAMLIKSARFYWGISAPVATFGAQIQQESAWHPRAQSPYAAGLAQFTPQTAAWISGAYKLGSDDPYDPAWAVRALTAYDHDLWSKITAISACDHMAFTLSAYNGGLGWVYRDKKLAELAGQSRDTWWHAVANYSHRSAAAFKENRDYPRRILFLYQPIYLPWGNGIDCSRVTP